MDRYRVLRTAAISLAVLAVFAGLVYLAFGVEWAEDVSVVRYFAFGASASVVLFGLRKPWPVRIVGAVVAVGVTYLVLGFWVESGIRVVLGLVGVAAVAAGVRSEWHGTTPVAVALVGLVLFAFEASGMGGCNSLGYPPEAGYGMEYDWRSNEIHYAETLDGEHYRCAAKLNSRVAAVGYAFTVVGTIRIIDNAGDDA